MSENSAIEWTTHTFNTWWGCARVSPGCRFCYADGIATRYGHELWRRKGERRMLSDNHWRQPLKWNRDAENAGKPAKVFCASMADVFELHPDPATNAELDAARARLWDLIDQTPWLRWQLLTKRPQNVMGMVPWGALWPSTVWLGTSTEDQIRADERIPVLLDIPAKVRFLSAEPLLGPIDLAGPADQHGARSRLTYWLTGRPGWGPEETSRTGLVTQELVVGPRISWVIVGGESGPKHRSMNVEWVRSLRDQCVSAGVPFLFKQHGGRTSKANGRDLDGRTWDEFPERVA